MENKQRWQWLDIARGIAVLQMLLYHMLYDYYVVFGHNDAWDFQKHIHLWQQLLVYSFIIIAGITCSRLKLERIWRQTVKLSLIGLLITGVTMYFLPSQEIIYGVITFVGCAYGLEGLRRRIFPNAFKSRVTAVVILFLLWLLTYDIRTGHYGWFGIQLWDWPQELYHPGLGILGLAPPPFFSADYVPLLPHFFVFEMGVVIGERLEKNKNKDTDAKDNFVALMGRYSLVIYLIHQPIILGISNIVFKAGN